MKKVLITILGLITILSSAKSVLAASDRLPETMVGQTKVYYDNNRPFYGGFEGSEAVYNYTNNADNASGGAGQTMGRSLAPSLAFNSASDQYVNTKADIGEKYNQLTVSFWFKATTKNRQMTLVSKADPGKTSWSIDYKRTGDGTAFMYSLVGDRLSGNGSTERYVADEYFNKWVQFALVYNGSIVEIYINGAISGSMGDNYGNIVDTTAPVLIGKNAARANSNFDGMMDDVRVYDNALTPDIIQKIYYGTDNFSKQDHLSDDGYGLAGYWDFQDGSGTIARDVSGSGSNWDADLINSPLWKPTDGPFVTDPALYKNDGYYLFGFDKSSLTNCITDQLLGGIYNCFVSNTKNNNVKVMSSRTYVNKYPVTPILETAALYYPPKTMIVGDAYLGDMDPNNFNFWGRNLTQNEINQSSPDAYWDVKNYRYDVNSQASTTLTGTEFAQYKSRIESMKNEAEEINSSKITGGNKLYLQSSTINNAPNQGDKDKHPNGKVWFVDNGSTSVNINNSFKFEGIGTIIFSGNVSIANGVKIEAADPSSKLGIICMGDEFRISGNIKIEAAIYVAETRAGAGRFWFSGNNVDLYGSFVASSFIGLTPGGDGSEAKTNIRIFYDKRLDSGWPPGFRYLNMPHPTEN